MINWFHEQVKRVGNSNFLCGTDDRMEFQVASVTIMWMLNMAKIRKEHELDRKKWNVEVCVLFNKYSGWRCEHFFELFEWSIFNFWFFLNEVGAVSLALSVFSTPFEDFGWNSPCSTKSDVKILLSTTTFPLNFLCFFT